MFKEFREFIARGNVVDLAVGVSIDGAFSALIQSLIRDLVTPRGSFGALRRAQRRDQCRRWRGGCGRIRHQRGADGRVGVSGATRLVFADGAGDFRGG